MLFLPFSPLMEFLVHGGWLCHGWDGGCWGCTRALFWGWGDVGQWCDLPGGWQEHRALRCSQALASFQQELANPVGNVESPFLGCLYISCLGEQKGKTSSFLVKCCHGPEHKGQTPSLPELAATSGKRSFDSTTLSPGPEANLSLGGESTNSVWGFLFQSPG